MSVDGGCITEQGDVSRSDGVYHGGGGDVSRTDGAMVCITDGGGC